MTHWSEDSWDEERSGPMVRPYALTRGRTQPSRPDIELISLVSTVRLPGRAIRLQPEQLRTLALCRTPTAVVEVAAHLALPVCVVKILLGDLLDHELIVLSSPDASTASDVRFLQAVIDGIRRL
ncbi:DUF742 domain-containing protein [Streptomyces sp. NBC_01803]|uniref:DUF742 domain-containing protein n=1 Tax=Streptomyces sp. NBC_01803 TaxID=2975946 RepID=UPI002DD99A01|nr:DUF742 domain-containing protein [Streptomyces sp. NBC_01803]WSA46167.1 DUF742 domain-containing protein [Streptomyces sp. NBC_01803]